MTASSPDISRGAAVIEDQQRRTAAVGAKISTDAAADEAARRKSLGKAVRFVSGAAKGARHGARKLLAGHVMRGPGTRPKPAATVEGATAAAVEEGAAVKDAVVEGAKATAL